MLHPLIFLNKELIYLRNKNIVEYDITQGGYNCALKYDLLNSKDKLILESLDKHDRHVYLGNIAKEDRGFTKDLHLAFRTEIDNFIGYNEIDDSNILSIKKDSITFYNSTISETIFENVEFTQRHLFSSYLLVNKIEFYLNSRTNTFLYKGLPELDITDTLIEEIKKLLTIKESSTDKKIFFLLKEMRDEYLKKNLYHTYYKELNAINAYKIKLTLANNSYYCKDMLTEELFDQLDISYNYLNIILPLINTFI